MDLEKVKHYYAYIVKTKKGAPREECALNMPLQRERHN